MGTTIYERMGEAVVHTTENSIYQEFRKLPKLTRVNRYEQEQAPQWKPTLIAVDLVFPVSELKNLKAHLRKGRHYAIPDKEKV